MIKTNCLNLKKTIFVCLLLTAALVGRADDFRQLTLNDGLTGLSVSDVREDSLGLIWIATSNGVNLYNGHRLVAYQLPQTGKGLPNYCYSLTIDGDGRVVAATRAGVYRLERYGNAFHRIVPALDGAECVLAVGQRLYVGDRSGLYCVEKNGEPRSIDIGAGPAEANKSVRDLFATSDGSVWFTTRNGISRLDPKTDRVTYYALVTPTGLSKLTVVGNRVFVGSKNHGLYVMDTATGSYHQVAGVGNIVTDVRCEDGRQVCVATDGDGAYVVDAATEQVLEHYGISEAGDHRLPGNAVYTFMRSRLGVSWFGLYQQGLVHTFYQYPLFRPCRFGSQTLTGVNITGVLKSGQEYLASTAGRMYYYNAATGLTREIDVSAFGLSLPRAMIRYEGNFYVGSYDKGLLRIDGRTLTASRLSGDPKLSFASIFGMDIDLQGKLWIATSEGLYTMGRDGSLRNLNERNSKVPMGIHGIEFDTQGVGWIGSFYGTCLMMDDGQTFKTGDFPTGFFHQVPNLVFTRARGMMYGYYQNQVYYSDAAMQHFGRLQLPDGLLDERCIDLAIDRQGRYWMVTEKGLFGYDAGSGQVWQMGPCVGLRGTHFNGGTLKVDDNNRLWVGTNEGLYYLDIDSLNRQTGIPHFRVGVEHVIVGSTHYELGDLLRINDTRELRVGWNLLTQKLVMELVTDDYTQQTNRRYLWRMDNDTTWTTVEQGRPLVLSALGLGRHRLEVKQAGTDRASSVYSIYVFPSVLFWIELTVLVIALGLFIWWRQWKRNTKILLSEHVETEEALIEEMKEEREKYARSRSSDKELARLFRQMDRYVKENQPYLNSDSKMSDIATALEVSPSQLSQVFTLYVKEPYYDYINKFRLEEFKKLIREGKHRQFTIAALYEQCGFKKTSFFSTFRKVEGMTPTEYIQRVKSVER